MDWLQKSGLAVARKLAVVMHATLRTGELFERSIAAQL
jgi:hypothetical protein